jgi:hypothetical protein
MASPQWSPPLTQTAWPPQSAQMATMINDLRGGLAPDSPTKTSSFPTSAGSTFNFGGALFRSGDQEAYGMCERSTHESLTTLGQAIAKTTGAAASSV